MEDNLIPKNVVGKETDLEESRSFSSEEEAQEHFERAGKQLVNPGVWHELCGSLSAKFTVTDEYGNAVARFAEVNDHIRIDIPGLGNSTGDGYDWVQVEWIGEKTDTGTDEESISIKLRAAANPRTSNETAAHFFDKHATSTLVVHRRKNDVTVSYHGRNERPNIHTEKVGDNLRNAIVATAAVAGVSEMQWSALIKSLLD